MALVGRALVPLAPVRDVVEQDGGVDAALARDLVGEPVAAQGALPVHAHESRDPPGREEPVVAELGGRYPAIVHHPQHLALRETQVLGHVPRPHGAQVARWCHHVSRCRHLIHATPSPPDRAGRVGSSRVTVWQMLREGTGTMGDVGRGGEMASVG